MCASAAQEVGFEEARRAFHENERWKSGPTYVFVAAADTTERLIVFPPPTPRGKNYRWDHWSMSSATNSSVKGSVS